MLWVCQLTTRNYYSTFHFIFKGAEPFYMFFEQQCVEFSWSFWKLFPCFKISGWLQPTNLTSLCTQYFLYLNSSFVKISTNSYTTSSVFLKIFTRKFPMLLLLLEPEGGPWEHVLFSLFQTGLPRAMERMTASGPLFLLWNLIKRITSPSG